jgi:hypothetical protein
VHTYLFVDGLEVVARSDDRMAGLAPGQLLRPGGPLYPTDTPRHVEVAAQQQPEPGPDRLTVRIRLRGGTVIWSDLMYPGPDGRVVEEVRFSLEQYVGEIERAYAVSEGCCGVTPVRPTGRRRSFLAAGPIAVRPVRLRTTADTSDRVGPPSRCSAAQPPPSLRMG